MRCVAGVIRAKPKFWQGGRMGRSSSCCQNFAFARIMLIPLFLEFSHLRSFSFHGISSFHVIFSLLFVLRVDVDECLSANNSCHRHADCLNTPGSFSCRCKRGYEGSGFECKCKWLSKARIPFSQAENRSQWILLYSSSSHLFGKGDNFLNTNFEKSQFTFASIYHFKIMSWFC